ncbi:MAG: hypothetical protein ACR2JY_01345 [Chloroflexota bacterium]
MVQMQSKVFTAQVSGLFLMAAGWGWNAGNFVQPTDTSWGVAADILHAVPLAILLPLSLRFINAAMAGRTAGGVRNGITGVTVFGIVGCLVMIALGATNPDPNSVGVHSIADWMPVVVQNAGNFLWLTALLPAGGALRAATTRVA